MLCLVRNGVLSVLAGSLAALLILAPSATAAPIFFGPTPYLSTADSPFDLSGLGTTMFLEDFEDGELNTPGVSDPALSISLHEPGLNTDSVDADDGVIDGLGRDGHSGLSSEGLCTDGEPPTCWQSVFVIFDIEVLGRLPTAVGIVWTDGSPLDGVSVEVFDEQFRSIASSDTFHLGDDNRLGGTAEDRFLGVVDADGIFGFSLSAHRVGGFVSPFEVDHLQYGFFVPEASTFLLIVLGALCLSLSRAKRE